MKKFYVALLALSFLVDAQAQHSPDREEAWKELYRESAPIENALVHTRLEVSFNYDSSLLYGKAQITLKPHFYATNHLTLDAKSMLIHKVYLIGTKNTPLKYEYNDEQLSIQLDKTYKKGEQYKIGIEYTAQPDKRIAEAGSAIRSDKGLYFINPKGEDKEKPVQIWTQGEPESNSVWFPTIDKPNQKTTQEIYMTVPQKYVTLSNGLLLSQKANGNGTRTDYWKMDKPHAPYLFFMGVGDFAIVKDKYKNIDVHYYVEKEYEPVARKIFGHTPEMIGYFSKLLGVEYPWSKYHQLVARDYVSGAMENTTAVIHADAAHQDARSLKDKNTWEGTIVHELFHHWFGDLITTESWSNLTVNESFANYSQYLWDEYKYGKDEADYNNAEEMNGYLFSGSEEKNLVRFYYERPLDMFDAVSYNKGGRILHMLRNHIGDDAFFTSLNVFLKRHAYQAVEAHQLRLAFEEVTGKDLNWFFNQWYFGNGHPVLDIKTAYNADTKKASVIIEQKQEFADPFKLPVAIDIYHNDKKVRHQVWVNNKIDTFYFDAATKPGLINVDGDKVLLTEKHENKTGEEYLHQFKYAGLYMDRLEALIWASQNATSEVAKSIFTAALNDKFYQVRRDALSFIRTNIEFINTNLTAIEKIANTDPSGIAKGAALEVLAVKKDQKYAELFKKNLYDSSYYVAGAALKGYLAVQPAEAMKAAEEIAKSKTSGKLSGAIMEAFLRSEKPENFAIAVKMFKDLPLSQEKFNYVQPIVSSLIGINDTERFKQLFDIVEAFKQELKPHNVNQYVDQLYTQLVNEKRKNTDPSLKAALEEQIKYVQQFIGK
ncbi:M1 family metallopeptidase [Gynurincola endophyticus]|uniref:M1 family metallopeptidase n=1 Tax=Gynurincola endophyticus TaxID=2479004 RepID=UPI000F8CE7A1|nr:M1 family metallopeptidase [Gynurincola endophyticus]